MDSVGREERDKTTQRREERRVTGGWRWIVISLSLLSLVSFLITLVVMGLSFPRGGYVLDFLYKKKKKDPIIIFCRPKADITLGQSETRIVSIQSQYDSSRFSTFRTFFHFTFKALTLALVGLIPMLAVRFH